MLHQLIQLGYFAGIWAGLSILIALPIGRFFKRASFGDELRARALDADPHSEFDGLVWVLVPVEDLGD
jgi:hypothetical protein